MGSSMNVPRVRNRIRELRVGIDGMTQEKLAKLCDVTRQTIIALEAGRYSPSLELAFRIARALGRTLDEVFQWSEEK
jgi:putative transcriptional regulator